MINTLRLNTDYGSDFHPLADHMTKLRNFTKGEIREFSEFTFLLQLMIDQQFGNLIISLMISQTCIQHLHKRTSTLDTK